MSSLETLPHNKKMETNEAGQAAAALAECDEVAMSRESNLDLLRRLQKRLKKLKAPSHLPSIVSELAKTICKPGLSPGNYLPALGQLHNVAKPFVERGGDHSHVHRAVTTFESLLDRLLESETTLVPGIRQRLQRYHQTATRWLQRLGTPADANTLQYHSDSDKLVGREHDGQAQLAKSSRALADEMQEDEEKEEEVRKSVTRDT